MKSTAPVASTLKWGAVTAAALLPLLLPQFWIGLTTVILLYTLAALGLAFVFAHGGMLDVGHAVYFAAASYTVALASLAWPQPPLILWVVIGTGVAALAGLFVRLILYRVGGLYLALATLALAVSAQALLEGSDWAGKYLGLTLRSRDLFGLGDVGPGTLYLVAAISTIVGLWLVANVPNTHNGRIITTVRTVRTVAEVIGVDSARVELNVFVIGAAISGWAGGVFVVVTRLASPDLAGLSFSLELLIMNIVGGVRAPMGPLYGALAVRGLPEVFQQLRDWQSILMGAFLLAVLAGFRGGIDQVIRTIANASVGALAAVGRPKPYMQQSARLPAELATGEPDARRPAAGQSSFTGFGQDLEASVLLETRDLTKHFGGVVAVDGVGIRLCKGQLHALVGPNGSGKTTIVDIISGFTSPTSGSVFVSGRDVGTLSPSRRSALGMTRTFQLMKLSPDLTIRENIMIGAHLWSSSSLLRSFLPRLVKKDELSMWRGATATMRLLGIEAYANALPGEVPAGIQRLTEVGRCLIGNARVLLLDEPAAGLSEEEVRHLGALLRSVVRRDVAVLLVEHNMDLVLEIADRVTVIDAGRIIASDTPDLVVDDPAVIAAYLGKRHAEALASSGEEERGGIHFDRT